jgi:hypothetical protein
MPADSVGIFFIHPPSSAALVYQMQLGGQLDAALQERCCRFIRSML